MPSPTRNRLRHGVQECIDPDAEDLLQRDFDWFAPREARAALADSADFAVV